MHRHQGELRILLRIDLTHPRAQEADRLLGVERIDGRDSLADQGSRPGLRIPLVLVDRPGEIEQTAGL